MFYNDWRESQEGALLQPTSPMSSSGLTGRSSIPETLVLERISRGVLDARRSLSSGGHSADPLAGMTAEGRASAFSRRDASEVCVNFAPENVEGAGKAGCRLHPWVPCKKKHGGRTTGSTGNIRLSLRDGFTAYFMLSPVTGLSCHRRFAEALPQNLAPASGRQDHTTSPSAGSHVRLAQRRVHRIPPRVHDDSRSAPRLGETRGVVEMICPTGEAEYFSKEDWTTQITLKALPN